MGNQNHQNLVPVMKILILLHLTKNMNLMNLKRNLSLKKESPKNPPNTNQPTKNTTLPNQKLKNRLKNDGYNVVKPQILHIGCSLCSMKIQAPLDGHTIPMVNSRFWTRKNWPKCGANHEVPLQKIQRPRIGSCQSKIGLQILKKIPRDEKSIASMPLILLRNKQDSSPCGPRGAKSYVLMLPILNDTEKLVMLPKLPQNTVMNFKKCVKI